MVILRFKLKLNQLRRKTMNSVIYVIEKQDQYRGSEFSSEGIGAPERADVPMISQSPTVSAIDERGHKDAQTAHEQRLESFMEEVKTFIRNIDISRL
jgi:hypothetical protein